MEPADLSPDRLDPLAGRLLVASPALVDPSFARTVVLLLDVDDGVLGVVLNRPSDLAVADVLRPWADVVGAPRVLFRGGPVDTDSALAVGRLVTDGEPVGWRRLYDGTGLVDLDAPSEVVVPALGGMRIFAGYAGWSSGQLQDEIDEGAWYVVPAAREDVFDTDPDRLWRQVLRRQPGPLAWLATYPEDPTQN
ncbi:MAG: YqgE/AlgH family protein [Marmoricola sp.]